jgi:hypothetical protein
MDLNTFDAFGNQKSKIAIRLYELDLYECDVDYEAFVERSCQLWLTAINLTEDLVNLGDNEIRSLEHYLYACELMVHCKQAAVRLSPQTWQAIEDRILTLPN